MFKSAFLKDIFREIWKTRSRFLSIFAIIALGTGFFAGVKSTSPDMKNTAQTYFKQTNLMDIHLKSTMGFNDKDIEAIRKVDDLKNLSAGYSTDAFVSLDNNNKIVVRAYSIDINQTDNDKISGLVLLSGRMPESINECVIDQSMLSRSGTEEITLISDDGDISDVLNTDTFKIVGVVRSPVYITDDRGSSSIGNGTIRSIIYLPNEAFDYEVYTDIYITFADTNKINFYDKLYETLIDEKIDKVQAIADVRQKERYDEIYSEAMADINEGQQELDNGKAEYDKNKNIFYNQIAYAEKQLAAGKTQLEDSVAKYNAATTELKDGWAAYNTALADLDQQAAELAANEEKLNQAQNELDELSGLLTSIDQLLTAYRNKSIPDKTPLPVSVQGVVTASSELNSLLGGVSFDKKLMTYIRVDAATPEKAALNIELSGYTAAIWSTVKSNQITLDEQKSQIESGKIQISVGYEQLKQSKAMLEETEDQLEDAANQIAAAKKEIAENEKALASEKQKGINKLADALSTIEENQQKLDDARDDLADLKEPKWYILDRDNNPGYSGYADDADRVNKIAEVFPIFFILVAALVCLTTMTRMVEEQRTDIGTLKALGYSKGQNIAKYLVYAITASLLGSFFGLAVGFKVFPTVIFNAYKNLYNLDSIIAPFRWDIAGLCIAASVLCTGLAALAACYKALYSPAAELMRPKSPKSGKSILLEKIPFVWNKLSFLQKVTARNLFRYKRKILMTVIGIAGCTALMLTGFGMRYSVSSVVDIQYQDISIYDLMGIFDEKIDQNDLTALINEVQSDPDISDSMLIRQKLLSASSAEKDKKEAYLVVAQDQDSIKNFVKIQNRITKEPISLNDDGVVITEKLSRLLSVKTGDIITVYLNDNETADFKVTGIMENYTLNYIYISKDAYVMATGQVPLYNAFMANVIDPTTEKEDALYARLMENSNILAVSYTSVIGANFKNIVTSLNYVVLLIIFSAGTLAFVVLYNLANINVTERIREIATIKVLGFYDKEVSAYIHRENTISAFIGMLIGLFLGIPFEKFIMSTAEVDAIMFLPGMNAACYFMAIALTLIFTYIVNFALHFRLKKVDMVESLKSID